MRLFGSDRIAPLIEKLGMQEGEAIEYSLLSKQIENAQKRVESRNFDIRKSVLQYDDVMNQQRAVIYAQRREVLEGVDMLSRVAEMRHTLISEAVKRATGGASDAKDWSLAELTEYLERICEKQGAVEKIARASSSPELLEKRLEEASVAFYQEREDMISRAGIDMREFERVALLGSVDRRWMDHIDAMDQLRDGIALRAYGQRDPVIEYKMEGYDMFDEMIRLIQEDTLRRLYMAMLVRPPERKEIATPVATSHGGGGDGTVKKRPASAKTKVGRNDPCPCGSGKKYKECCGKG
jgi:preprotein translocase subunit SecA